MRERTLAQYLICRWVRQNHTGAEMELAGKPYINSFLNTLCLNITERQNAREKEQARKENREPVLLPRFSCYILRHCYAARMAEAGISPKTLQVLMGHTDIGTTMNIYANIDMEAVKKEVQEAEKYMNAI